MGAEGKEPTFCMGDDTPLAVLSVRPHMVYDYIKQRFAQVTNPAIDPLREGLVMSLEMKLGKKSNILQAAAQPPAPPSVPSPFPLKGRDWSTQIPTSYIFELGLVAVTFG